MLWTSSLRRDVQRVSEHSAHTIDRRRHFEENPPLSARAQCPHSQTMPRRLNNAEHEAAQVTAVPLFLSLLQRHDPSACAGTSEHRSCAHAVSVRVAAISTMLGSECTALSLLTRQEQQQGRTLKAVIHSRPV